MRKIVLLVMMWMISSVSYGQTLEPHIYTPSNVRSGPSENYSIRASLWQGNSLTVTGKNNFAGEWLCTDNAAQDSLMWLRVDLQGIEGWVNYCVVNFTGDLDSLPVAEPAFPELDEWINLATIPDGLFFTRITDKLGNQPDQPYVIALTRTRNFIHLREYPNLGANILDHISSEQVYVTGISPDGVWVQVEYDAKITSCLQNADSTNDCPYERISGWVARYLLSLSTDWQETLAEES